MALAVKNGQAAVRHSDANVMDFGAVGDSESYDTNAIQRAVDSLYHRGGGTLYFPAGSYLIKTVLLRDNVTLELGRGAVILGSKNLYEDNPHAGYFSRTEGRPFKLALFIASAAKNITISGEGTIDGQGFSEFYPISPEVKRPSLIRFVKCQNVRIEGITLINSASWVQHYIECSDLTIRGITVISYANKNNDGLTIDGCQRVIISQCKIDSEDDSIVLKSFSPGGCRDIMISDCIIGGLKSAIKTGTESLGNFENISISNCVIYGTRGISLLSVDGGHINNVTISNISMRESYAVLVIRLGDRMRPYAVSEDQRPREPGQIRNIMVSHVQATGVSESNDFICGIPGYAVENVSLSHINIEVAGGGSKADAQHIIPEKTDEYPKAKMFGTLPACGFFIRHARRIHFDHVSVTTIKEDARPLLIAEDVVDLELENLSSRTGVEQDPFILLKNTQQVLIRDSRSMDPVKIFLKIEGPGSRGIRMLSNPQLRTATGIERGEGVPADVVTELIN